MPTACINTPGCKVRLASQRLEVHGRDEDGNDALLRQIPLRDLERILVLESVQVTSEALGALLRAGIPVSILGRNGRCLGAFLPAGNAHGAWRLRQYQNTLDANFALPMAGRIVAAKIYNQRRVLQRMANNRQIDLIPAMDALGALLSACGASQSIDELRGFEGAASARYFAEWARLLPPDFPFERRSTRPPLNPVNACLSFASTLLYNETVSFIHAHGLDPALGLLHTTQDERWSLALDLMEPFRPVLAEALTIDLFTHQIVNAKHFRPHEGGIYLNDDGRSRLLIQYERRMERQFMSECAGHRTTLRQQLETQATRFKAALEDPARFEPFLMN